MKAKILAPLWRAFPEWLRSWVLDVTNTRYTISVGAVIVDKEQRVLILEHRFWPHDKRHGLPGGMLERYESPATACEREVLEETGLTVKADTEPFFYHLVHGPKRLVFYFRCTMTPPQQSPKVDGDEILAGAFYAKNDLPSTLHPSHVDVLERAQCRE